MTICRIAIALMFVAGLASAPAAVAQDRDRGPRQFGEGQSIVLRPDRAYIFYRTPSRTTFRFFKEVDEAETAAHAAARAEAFARVRTRAERRLELWNEDRRTCGRGSVAPRCREPRPTIPSEAEFEFPDVLDDNFVGNAYRPRLLHQEAWSGWLIAVDPGVYQLYGEVTETPNGTAGVCYCMGSVRFEARAGEITDMGEIVLAPAALRGDPSVENFRLGHYVTVAPWAESMRSPAQFANLRVVPAQLRAAGKVANHFGIPITRLAPIDGVLAYDRDVVIDVRSGERLPTPDRAR